MPAAAPARASSSLASSASSATSASATAARMFVRLASVTTIAVSADGAPVLSAFGLTTEGPPEPPSWR